MDFGPESDVDLLLDVDVKEDLEAGRALWNVWDGLEAFFQRPVDMLTEDSLRNPYLRKEIERAKVKIYDGASRQNWFGVLEAVKAIGSFTAEMEM